jgi:hypothetical protein
MRAENMNQCFFASNTPDLKLEIANKGSHINAQVF